MSEIKNLLTSLNELGSLKAKVELLKEAVLQEISPYKIGDTVDIKGYSHVNKKGIIDRLRLTVSHEGSIDISVCVKVLRKDGSVSNFRADWDSYYDAVLKSALQKIINN